MLLRVLASILTKQVTPLQRQLYFIFLTLTLRKYSSSLLVKYDDIYNITFY